MPRQARTRVQGPVPTRVLRARDRLLARVNGRCATLPVHVVRVNTALAVAPRVTLPHTTLAAAQRSQTLAPQGRGGQALQNPLAGPDAEQTGKGAGAMRAILYARVSTDRQAERCGLEAQRRMLRKRAAERGYEVVGDVPRDSFADDESGGTLDRPAWRRVEEAAERGLADAPVTLDPDRLSRDLTDDPEE